MSSAKFMLDDTIPSPSLTLASSSSPTNQLAIPVGYNNQLSSSSSSIPTLHYNNHTNNNNNHHHHHHSLMNFLQFSRETNASTITHDHQVSPRGGGGDDGYGFLWDMDLEENSSFQNGVDAMRSFEVDNNSMVL